MALWWAAGAENGPADEQKSRCDPAHIQRRPHLPLQRFMHDGIVKVSDDGVGRPGHGHHSSQSRKHECDPRDHDDPCFGPWVTEAVCAVSPNQKNEESQAGQSHGGHDQPARRLQGRIQIQQRVVEFTLHLTDALVHTRHPQALPEDLSHHDVCADEGRHLPHGQSADDDGSCEANH